MPNIDAGSVLRESRRRANLSQVGLAARAGVTQSVISAYEAGKRQPSLPMLERLIAATGFELDVHLRREPRRLGRLTGPLGQRVRRSRRAIVDRAATRGVVVLGVFGSVARGQDKADSDIDLLVEVPEHVGLVGLAAAQRELQDLVDAPFDLVPRSDLKPGVRDEVLREVVPL